MNVCGEDSLAGHGTSQIKDEFKEKDINLYKPIPGVSDHLYPIF